MGRKTNPSSGELSMYLHRYETLNNDLPKPVCRQLFQFAASPYCSPKELDDLFQTHLGQTPRRHRSFFWYNTMLTSGLGDMWDQFASMKNSGSPMSDCVRRLKNAATHKQWITLSKRHGCGIFNNLSVITPNSYKTVGSHTTYWSRGGVWGKRNGLTKVIVLGELMERNPYNNITKKLLPYCDKLTKEVYNLVDEEKMLVPDAIDKAVDYIRHRVRDVIGWSPGPTHMRNVSWFFQCAIPSGLVWYDWRKTIAKRRVDGGKVVYYQWIPPQTDK